MFLFLFGEYAEKIYTFIKIRQFHCGQMSNKKNEKSCHIIFLPHIFQILYIYIYIHCNFIEYIPQSPYHSYVGYINILMSFQIYLKGNYTIKCSCKIIVYGNNPYTLVPPIITSSKLKQQDTDYQWYTHIRKSKLV